MDVTSFLLGKQAGGGGGANLQSNKTVTVATNGETVVNPDSGYDGMKKTTITANVQPNLESKEVTINSNTTTNVTPTAGKDGLSGVTVITNVPTGGGTFEEAPEKDVNFYDYDGTRIYSYTKSDFLNLTSLPENPEHTGLTAQGWNWSLADAKAYMQDAPKLIIGQMYITNDGSTRLYIELEGKRLKPAIGFAINGTATIDWGDETTPDTVTGTSTTTNIYTSHTYANEGNYVIKITSEQTIYLKYDYNGSGLFTTQDTTVSSNYAKLPYINALKKIELGNVYIDQYAFQGFHNLTSMTIPIPNNTTSAYCSFTDLKSLNTLIIPSGVVGNLQSIGGCNSLKHIILPNNITGYATSFNSNCSFLDEIILPDTVTSVGALETGKSRKFVFPKGTTSLNGADAFSGKSILTEIIVRGSISNIYARTFQNCYNVKRYDFTSYVSVPTLANANAFSNIASDCKIVVPDSLYNDWKSADVWSTYESYIIKASDE